MKEITRKGLTVALAAVLLFVTMVPVPVGNRYVDAVTHDKAHANPAVIAPAVIFATALTAYGVYVAGTTAADYNANVQSLYDDYKTFNGLNDEQMVALLSPAVTAAGNIDLSQLGALFGAIPIWAAALIGSGDAVTGSSSVFSAGSVLNVGTGTIPMWDSMPSQYATDVTWMQAEMDRQNWNLSFENDYTVIAYHVPSANSREYFVVKNIRFPIYWVYYGNEIHIKDVAMIRFSCYDSVGKSTIENRGTTSYQGVTFSYHGFKSLEDGGSWDLRMNPNLTYELYSGENLVSSSSQGLAVAEEGVVNNTAIAPTDTVQPFEPTAEQLNEGYDSTAVLQAQIDTANATLGDVLAQLTSQGAIIQGLNNLISALSEDVSATQAGVAGIGSNVTGLPDFLQGILDAVSPINGSVGGVIAALNPLSSIATAVASIVNVVTGLQANPFDWLAGWWATLTNYWEQLLAWLGELDFDTVMRTVISGVQAIPGSIAGGIEDVLEGVGAIPGVIVGAGVDIVDAVLSLPATISGVLDGIFAGEATSEYTPSGDGLRFRDELKAQLDLMLDMKAPFCYMRRMQALASNVSGNFTADPSFYFDVNIPFGGVQRFDAGELLNQTWGNRTLAQYLRILLTGSICAGLLAIALKLAIGRIGAKEEG